MDKVKGKFPILLAGRPVLHIYFWGFFFTVLFLQSIKERSLPNAVLYDSCFIALLAIPVYVNLYGLNRLIHRKKYLLYAFCVTGLILTSALLTDRFFIILFNDWAMFLNRIFTIFVFILLTTAIKFAKAGFQQKSGFEEKQSWIPDRNTQAIDNDYMMIKCGRAYHRVIFNDILYIKGSGNYVIFYTASDEIMTLCKMSEILDKLPSGSFIRIHKSYIVNFKKVDIIEKEQVRIRDRNIPIGDAFRKNLEFVFQENQK
jgi:hypothetical protein